MLIRGFLLLGFVMLRPPLVANVEVIDESERRPLRVSFSGMRGDVIAASGPWRSSGEWWQEDGWDHDEWDLAIDFGKRAEPREKKPDDIVARMHAIANVGREPARERRLRSRVRGRGMVCIGFFLICRGRVGLCGDFTIRGCAEINKNVHRASCAVGVQFSRRICDPRGNGRGLRRARNGRDGDARSRRRLWRAAFLSRCGKKRHSRAYRRGDYDAGGMAVSGVGRIARGLPEFMPRDHVDEIACPERGRESRRRGTWWRMRKG